MPPVVDVDVEEAGSVAGSVVEGGVAGLEVEVL